MFGCWAIVGVSLLSTACGDSSDSSGAAGANSGLGGGAGTGFGTGLAGENGLAGSGSSGSSGFGSSGAGNSAGANNGSTCPAAAPCGGELLGDWTIKQACVELQTGQIVESCPGATVTLSPITATGMVSFKGDNTTTSSGTISFMQTVKLPVNCANEAQCKAAGASLATQPTISNAQCLYAATGCTCTVTSTQPVMNSGTYQIEGTNVTFTSTNGQPVVDRFCVSGNTLSLYETHANGSTATMILTR
ncbi:MAG TPA: hypothetical protein VJV79_28715 [Polyangiaceae bacterium]|nr:hypothetical protein [Polyangiaceae bacterium]